MSETPTDTDSNTTRADRNRNTLNTDVMQWLSALVALIGLYVVASPFIFEATDQAIWNDTLVGTGVFLLAGYNFVRLSRDRLASVGVASLAALLGLWLLIAPSVIDMGSETLATGTAASGAAIAALSAYNAYANKKADAPDHVGTRA
ncbi:SPW repeat protein [Haloterrigena alkaliphila]|uniref:SPW repeat protein n=1 Tax=Haloterrigena alkaliphila TaxID=2816475 RepID=A0A8A2VA30_9EURY|nr:SPW repeat protein [Haloterrigena alkaliphila]QSW98331.1 SPW repeat protein [Haloterrigena alkaliphila]